jgi:hypothetical protein
VKELYYTFKALEQAIGVTTRDVLHGLIELAAWHWQQVQTRRQLANMIKAWLSCGPQDKTPSIYPIQPLE